MKNLVLTVLVLGVAFVGLQAQASANLLTDSGFENGTAGTTIGSNVIDWTWSGGLNGNAFYTGDQAKGGIKSAKVTIWGGGGTDWAAFSKDFTGIDFTQPYIISGYFLRSATGDPLRNESSGKLQLKWFNGASELRVDESSAFNNSFSADTWNSLSFTSPTPPATANKLSAVVALTTSGTYTANSAYYVDDMSLNVVPEPHSLLLLGTGLVGLLGLSRRKRS